jgi:hypothetical protein
MLSHLLRHNKPTTTVFVVSSLSEMGMGEPLAKQKQARCVLGNDLVATLATLSPPITCVFLASKSRHQSLFAALADRVAKRFKCNFEWMNFDEQQLRSVEERNQIPQMMYRQVVSCVIQSLDAQSTDRRRQNTVVRVDRSVGRRQE